MKNTWLRFLAVPAIAGGMLLAAAPEVSTQPNPAAQQRAQRLQKRGDRIARFLNLTEAQRAQFTSEWQATRAAARPIHGRLGQRLRAGARPIPWRSERPGGRPEPRLSPLW